LDKRKTGMNRRKAIGRILWIGAGSGLIFSGYKWYDLNKTPDLAYLENKKDLLASLAETIIPRTDTPGAKDAGVENFILTMIRDCTETISQNKFIDGLKDLEIYSHHHYNKAYQACNKNEQLQVLKHFEEIGKPYGGILGKVQKRFLGKSFITTLKEYTVEGYCTSREGSTMALVYLPVPGRYEGCMKLQNGQKAWATN
jgi:hypothetical protein